MKLILYISVFILLSGYIVVNDISVVTSGSIESDIAGMSMQYFDMLLDNNETIIDRPLVVEVKDASGNITGISNMFKTLLFSRTAIAPLKPGSMPMIFIIVNF